MQPHSVSSCRKRKEDDGSGHFINDAVLPTSRPKALQQKKKKKITKGPNLLGAGKKSRQSDKQMDVLNPI